MRYEEITICRAGRAEHDRLLEKVCSNIDEKGGNALPV